MFIMNYYKRFCLLLISAFLIMPANCLASPTIEIYRNNQVKAIRPILDSFIYKNIQEYPYLYINHKETDYNIIFEKDPKAFVLLAKKDGKLIGSLQANPLDSVYFKDHKYSPDEALAKIKKNGFNTEKILYVTTFMMSKDERKNSSVAKKMFDKTLELAKSMGYSQICYDEIVETKNHPLKPNPYIPLEPWKELGRKIKNMNVEITMSWPTLQDDGKVKNEEHKLAFYIIE
ncbi:MAG: hypothetical protein K2X50_02040 [Gammaproteobacteria bacterium]|nr:hypothetical protein [Gammaproteobacteria bacterium]